MLLKYLKLKPKLRQLIDKLVLLNFTLDFQILMTNKKGYKYIVLSIKQWFVNLLIKSIKELIS